MASRQMSRERTRAFPALNAHAFLDAPAAGQTIVTYRRGETIFMRGDSCDDVLYIRSGGVTLSVRSKAGREVVVATLGPGHFFGEGCLAGQPLRTGDATAITPTVIVLVEKRLMAHLLHTHRAISARFIAHMLSRKTQIEEDLLDQLFDSIEKRLACTLLRLARYDIRGVTAGAVPKTSKLALAEMAGTTPALVKVLLKKFERLGFIEPNRAHALRINGSLLSVVLQD